MTSVTSLVAGLHSADWLAGGAEWHALDTGVYHLNQGLIDCWKRKPMPKIILSNPLKLRPSGTQESLIQKSHLESNSQFGTTFSVSIQKTV